MDTIAWSDFEKVEMRIGTIIAAKLFIGAKNEAYQIQINFGSEIGIKKTSAQITVKYAADDLIGKQVVAVVNFPKKQIGTFMSECLIMGSLGANNEVVLLSPDMKVENGLRIG